MESGKWRQIEELFNDVVSRAPEERSRLLSRADPEVRRDVERMLSQSGSLLDRPAWEAFPDGASTVLGPGKVLADRYEIETLLGKGGMGEVFRARDTRLRRTVAIKLIRADSRHNYEFHERFAREARALSALSHPHICGVYDLGEQDGSIYLVMEYIEGDTLASILRKGPLPLNLALRYSTEISGTISAAHAKGIIHRDLTPGNIMIAASGVKVIDFGLAKRLEPPGQGTSGPNLTAEAETKNGQICGTVAYMSPEQAEGRPADARSEVFSLGVLMYELFTGRRPFQGETPLSSLAAVLRDTPAPPRKIRPEIPEKVERVVLRCLQKAPEDRYKSAQEVHSRLVDLQALQVRRVSRRPALVAAAALITLIAAFGVRVYLHATRTRWAEKEALPEIGRLLAKDQLLAALPLYRKISEYGLSSPTLATLSENLHALPVTITTSPPGANIEVADYVDSSQWQLLGRSPVRTSRIPFLGYYRLRVVKQGYVPVEIALSPGNSQTVSVLLHTVNDTPAGMVWVPAASAGSFLSPSPPAAVPGFWIDKYEVTNRQFKQFVDAGGYRQRGFWTEPFVKDGRTIPWEQAMALFQDATGRPGPATWQFGSFPEGKADFPVGGVSWYEAAAYARFAGKSLPTLYHWYRAAGIGYHSDILQLSNFSGQAPAAVGANSGLSPFGSYDMAGNVKEWVENAADKGRYILGGAWDEARYEFAEPDAWSPFDRNPTFGFRCAKYISQPEQFLLGKVVFNRTDRRGDKSADDRSFQIFKDLHSYEKTALNPKVELVDDSSPYLRREDVTIQAAYGNERVLVHLYLPKNTRPPFQALAMFGSGAMFTARSIAELHDPFEFIVRSGRAVFIPAYKGTLERGPMPSPSQGREAMLDWSKDLGRSLDYLETRPDIDRSKFGFYGYSVGAALSPRLIAVEPRIKAALLVSGGSVGRMPAEVDPWNFAPRVQIPVLMLNGRDDLYFPLENSQLPLFRALGTAEPYKKRVVYEGGHINLMTRLDLAKEALGWLDEYLGPVEDRPR